MVMNIVLLGAKLLSALLVFLLLYLLALNGQTGEKALGSYRELQGLVRKASEKMGWYRTVETKLRKFGAPFHYGIRITPVKYLVVKLTLSLLVFLVLGKSSVMVGILPAGLMYLLPDWLLMYLNKKDNEKMLPQIRLLYHTMEIQIKAGVYVLDALSESYGGVTDKRLKSALLDLTGDIVMRADIYSALDRFQSKFENGHIDSLCVTVLQALESGQAVELLKDLGEQIKDVEQVLLERKKASLDRSLTFYQLGLLTIVLGIAIYVCVVQMLGMAVNL